MKSGPGVDLGKMFLSPRTNMRTIGINYFPFLLLLLIRWNIGLRYPELIKNYIDNNPRPLSLP